MSGGEWNYKQGDLKSLLQDVSNTKEMKTRFVRLSNIFDNLAYILHDSIDDLDYDISNDVSIENDSEFENQVIQKLREALSMETELEDINNELDKIEDRIANIKQHATLQT